MHAMAQVVVEPSGAAPLAAVLSDQFRAKSEWAGLRKTGIVVSGGNADLSAKGFWKLWHV